MRPTLAELRGALETGELDRWMRAVAAAGVHQVARDTLARVIDHDRFLWRLYPDAMSSCILARTATVEGLAGLHAAWVDETCGARRPWVRCLCPLPLPDGLLATLGSGPTLDLSGLRRVAFPEEDLVTLEPIRFHPTVQPPEQRRAERLRWRWQAGEVVVEKFPEAREPAPEQYPRFEHGGWGPTAVRTSPTSGPVPLPCPPEANAFARPSRRPGTVYVYGWHDEYDGGFVWVVRREGGLQGDETWVVEVAHETPAPVYSVNESVDGAVVLATTSAGLLVWVHGERSTLSIQADTVALSPEGRRIAVRTGHSVQVWDIARSPRGEVLRGKFPACFSPAGDRLLRGSTLYEGDTGRVVAVLQASFGQYLSGGPAVPWFHVGDHLVINAHLGREVWTAADGLPLELNATALDLPYPFWYRVAYDDAGNTLAVLHKGESVVELHSLPDGRAAGRVRFELDGERLALSPSGRLVAVAQGAAIEVRARAGDLVLRTRHPVKGESERSPHVAQDGLCFVDDERVASQLAPDGWRVFRLADGSSERVDPPRLGAKPGRPAMSDWEVVDGGHTVFAHRPTGALVALPVEGR